MQTTTKETHSNLSNKTIKIGQPTPWQAEEGGGRRVPILMVQWSLTRLQLQTS